jgi:prolyl-tRNA editing enzyme YbaK/EbsC (Cys-tRNA(Pro) deacylase)
VRVLPESASTPAAAADHLGAPVGAIATGRVLEVDGAPLLVISSAGHAVDENTLAALLGVPRVTPAGDDAVGRHTGQPSEGVAPIGHPEPIGTLVDVELARHDTVWAYAGHPRAVFPTSYEELLHLTAGTAAEVGAGPR